MRGKIIKYVVSVEETGLKRNLTKGVLEQVEDLEFTDCLVQEQRPCCSV